VITRFATLPGSSNGAGAPNPDLFEPHPAGQPESTGPRALGAGTTLIPGLAIEPAAALLDGVRQVLEQSPLRHMTTPGGFRMSVAMSNCGALGWVSDAQGYRYDPIDPERGAPWPPMPQAFRDLAARAASIAGFEGFEPDACLVNCYEPSARLTLHQDRNERDLRQPIVSVSLGLPALFLLGGARRADPVACIPLQHGDVVVWGGPDRLRHHGVRALKNGEHPLTGRCRINLTFRRAG
jgi:alkylated DNA repair protein (DNA oxidative demethylase)